MWEKEILRGWFDWLPLSICLSKQPSSCQSLSLGHKSSWILADHDNSFYSNCYYFLLRRASEAWVIHKLWCHMIQASHWGKTDTFVTFRAPSRATQNKQGLRAANDGGCLFPTLINRGKEKAFRHFKQHFPVQLFLLFLSLLWISNYAVRKEPWRSCIQSAIFFETYDRILPAYPQFPSKIERYSLMVCRGSPFPHTQRFCRIVRTQHPPALYFLVIEFLF